MKNIIPLLLLSRNNSVLIFRFKPRTETHSKHLSLEEGTSTLTEQVARDLSRLSLELSPRLLTLSTLYKDSSSLASLEK